MHLVLDDQKLSEMLRDPELSVGDAAVGEVHFRDLVVLLPRHHWQLARMEAVRESVDHAQLGEHHLDERALAVAFSYGEAETVVLVQIGCLGKVPDAAKDLDAVVRLEDEEDLENLGDVDCSDSP